MTEFPLWRDPSAKFVPWIISMMLYLATFSFLFAFMMHKTLGHSQMKNHVIVELPTAEASFFQELKRFPGLKNFKVLSRAEIIETLKPWGIWDHMPLPVLIDIEINSPPVFQNLFHAVKQHDPAAHIESTDTWGKSRQAAQWLSIFLVGLIFSATIGTIAFTTQTSLIIHRKIIEVLHLMGARNSYIAKQFQLHTFHIGLISSGISLLLMGVTFLLLYAHDFSGFLTGDSIALLVLVPTIMTFFMMISARLTVLIVLRKP